MKSSDFREWTLDKIDDAFGCEMVRRLPSLDSWLSFKYELNDFEKKYLSILRDNYFWGGESWNEAELENKIISPIFVFAKFDNRKFAYFLERELKANIGEHELSGRVDGMIATGFRNPKEPYFCLNEYKRETDPNGEPKGQALIAMLAAQALNKTNATVFGCSIVGKQWTFMALEDRKYALSTSFDVDNDEIFEIYRILKGLQSYIEAAIKKS